MSLVASVLALGWFAQTPAPFTLFGDSVTAEAPKIGQTELATDVKAWPGWGPLGAPGCTFPEPFLVDGDWSSVAAATSKPDSTPFRVRVILIPSVDLLYRTSTGNLDERRTSINGPCRIRIEQGLALAGATLQAQTTGRLSVVYDTSVDGSLYEERVEQGDGLGAAAVSAYVRPRINGGGFEANDKLYHGPYHLCLVVHAGLTAPVQVVECGTPIATMSASVADASVSACAKAVLETFGKSAEYWSMRHGHKPETEAEDPIHINDVFGNQPIEQILTDVSFGPPETADYIKSIQTGGYFVRRSGDASYQMTASMSGNAQLSLDIDPAKGTYLSVKLSGLFRNGGFALPTPKDFPASFIGENHFLLFDFRTNSHDPIGIGLTSGGAPDDPAVVLGTRHDAGPCIPSAADGAWHRIALDMGKLGIGAGAGGIYAGFSPESRRFPKNSVVVGSYDFANFSLASTAPEGALTATTGVGLPWDAGATEARAAAKAVGTPEGNLMMARFLDSHDDPIRLNAFDALANVKAPGLEEKLAAAIGNLDPRITEAAITALAFQDTPTSWATLTRTVLIGPGTHAKAFAAGFVATRKDPGSTGPMSAVQSGSRDWEDRALVAKALGLCDIPQAWLFLRSCLEDDDPGVRAVATDQIDPNDDDGMRKLLFVSVNDPSDDIRSEACIKLLQSAMPEIKREGYRGTADDSWWVRVKVLDWIAAHPTSDDRPALRQAITSPYAGVRAAALRALATSSSPVTLEEVANALHDPMPRVQFALIGLVKAKSLSLPADVIAALRASVDEKVAAAAATLAGA